MTVHPQLNSISQEVGVYEDRMAEIRAQIKQLQAEAAEVKRARDKLIDQQVFLTQYSDEEINHLKLTIEAVNARASSAAHDAPMG